jgi:hypothetical protein
MFATRQRKRLRRKDIERLARKLGQTYCNVLSQFHIVVAPRYDGEAAAGEGGTRQTAPQRLKGIACSSADYVSFSTSAARENMAETADGQDLGEMRSFAFVR